MKVSLVCVFLSVMLTVSLVVAQKQETSIKVIAWPQGDSIILRWAPSSPASWRLLNKYGYKIERYTIMKDSVLLSDKPLANLSDRPILPAEQKVWQTFGESDDYILIAAQSIFGQKFEINPSTKPGILESVSKATELESRYTFALFAADLSMNAANLSGLCYVDKSVKKEESYLYRVYSLVPENVLKIEMGFAYTGLRDQKLLPAVSQPRVEFGNKIAKISLTVLSSRDVYAGYYLEKSEDGKIFQRLNKSPLIAMSNQDNAAQKNLVYFDSLKSNDVTCYYRVVGLTPFGVTGPVSKQVSGNGFNKLEIRATGVNAKTSEDKVLVTWDFQPDKENLISGFEVERSDKANGQFENISGKITKEKRDFLDNTPNNVNYYKVVTLGDKNQRKESFPILLQLIDSIPPSAPQKVLANIDSSGIVRLAWNQNNEKDLAGYRVFRSNFRNAEFSQITISSLSRAAFVDTVNLKTLSRKIYYKVAAQDKHSNTSPFSDVVEVTKPDKVPPMPPVFKSFGPKDEGIELLWSKSSSDDVAKQYIQCKSPGNSSWIVLVGLTEKDSSYFHDTNGVTGNYAYQLVAEDKNGLKSKPSQVIVASSRRISHKPAIENLRSDVDRSGKSIKIKWAYEVGGVKKIEVFRSDESEAITLYRTLRFDAIEFEDTNVKMNKTYRYRLRAVFKDGTESGFSRELKVDY